MSGSGSVVRPARMRAVGLVAALAALFGLLAFAGTALANHPEVSLSGSNFEIDTDANLKVDDPAPSLDWGNVVETRKADKPSGGTDDSFGQGAKEDTAVPTVVSGSIPPNKSDLLDFGSYLETTATGQTFLNLFWHRVQEPSGTTNMDFEFNQSSVISGNGVTPVRTAGDLLIQYDLSQGGTNPVLFVSRWLTTGDAADCESSNSLPCWSTKENLSAAGDATGSINTSAIPEDESDGLGTVSPRTFGEAQLDFAALTGGSDVCTSFGSVYLKSRSSDSFTSELKDFIAPVPTNISNCATVIIRKQTDPDQDPNATDFGFSKTFATNPATPDTFTLKDDGVQIYTNVVLGSNYTVDEEDVPEGWDLTGIDCNVAGHASSGVLPLVSLGNGTVTFSIDSPGDVLDCTYTNTERGSITVGKVTDPPTATDEFGFSGDLAGSIGNGEQIGPVEVVAGSYDTTEAVPAGWSLTDITCDDDDSDGDESSGVATFEVDPGEDVVCTYTNTQDAMVTIIKDARPNDAQDFGFTGSFGAFTLDDDGAGESATPSQKSFVVSAGQFGAKTVTETAVAGWGLADITCSEGTDSGATATLQVDPGDAITCTFVNQKPAIAVAKSVRLAGTGEFGETVSAPVGSTVEYRMLVTNTGVGPLVTVAVSDPRCDNPPAFKGGDTDGDGELDETETWTFTCTHVITAADGSAFTNTATANGKDKFGNPVSAKDTANVTVPAQQVEPELPGTARLRGPSGCVKGTFRATVRGTRIASVTFFVDGKRFKKLTSADGEGTRFSVKINPKGRGFGVHRVTARIVFNAAANTSARTQRLSFQRCKKQTVKPRFTG